MSRPHRTEDISSHETDRRSFRRSYFLGNTFEVWVALAAICAGIVFLVQPDAVQGSTVARQAGLLSVVWAFLYGAGGLLIFIGLWIPSPQIEVCGLFLFGSAVTIDGVALLVFQWPVGARTGLLYLALVAAAATRGFLVVRLAKGIPRARR